MINVTLNVVGLYYGQTFAVKDDPSVLDVLKAADGELTTSGRLTFKMNANNPNSIWWVENDLTELEPPILSRKSRLTMPARQLKEKVIRLEEGVFNQASSSGQLSLISVAWQYYIEKARVSKPLVTTTYSIDNVIVDAGKSNDATEGKKIEDGDTVTLRLLCINTTYHGRDDAPDGLPPR